LLTNDGAFSQPVINSLRMSRPCGSVIPVSPLPLVFSFQWAFAVPPPPASSTGTDVSPDRSNSVCHIARAPAPVYWPEPLEYRPLLAHRVPNPMTWAISCMMTDRRVPLASMLGRSAVSNRIDPAVAYRNPPWFEKLVGPAEPSVPPGPPRSAPDALIVMPVRVTPAGR